MQPLEDYVKQFNEKYEALLQIAPTINSVDTLRDKDEELAFVQAFRELMRL